MDTQNRILVVMPCINLWDRYSKQCLESVLKSELNVPFAILVIDNNSTDGTPEKLEAFKAEHGVGFIHYIRNDHNKGCAPTWNQGVKWGVEDKLVNFTHFLIINNDILVSPKTIQGMYDRMQTVSADGGKRKMLVSAIDVAGEIPVPEMILDPNHAVNNKEVSEAPHPHFSCFMITKETLEVVGYFDEQFYPAYFEDNSYHYRCKLLAGSDSAITVTQVAFYHFGSRTQNEAYGGVPVVPGEAFNANRQRFIKLWGNVPGQESFNHPYNDESLSAKLNADQTYEKLVK